MLRVDCRRAPYFTRFAPFAGLSLAAHVAIFGLLGRAATLDTPAFDPAVQTLSGDSFDAEPLVESESEPSVAATQPGRATTSTPGTKPPRDHIAPGARAAPLPAAGPFGAVGLKYATDLATTFTRAFPQAASADAIWLSAPFGSAGSADVTLTLDDDGHLVDFAIAGAPTPALRRGIERTLALIGPRSFTAQGRMTRLRVTARVARDEIHDGLHGDVFALSGGSFAGSVGGAFFAIAPATRPGFRVDIEVKLLR